MIDTIDYALDLFNHNEEQRREELAVLNAQIKVGQHTATKGYTELHLYYKPGKPLFEERLGQLNKVQDRIDHLLGIKMLLDISVSTEDSPCLQFDVYAALGYSEQERAAIHKAQTLRLAELQAAVTN